MYKIYKHIYNHRYLYQISFTILLLLFLVFPEQTQANAFINALDGFVANIINWLNRFQFWVLDQFILPLIEAAMTFDDFFNAGVEAGYNVVRDFANLLLGLLLLFVAIGTVLDFGPFSEYNIKSKLPNFILSALLINYSLPLIALGIDISQIIMIEFYNAIVAGGSLADHLASFTDLSMVNRGSTERVVSESTIENIGGAVADSHIVLSLVIAAITAVINVIFLWLAAILVNRIAILMMLSMTAPLAFISNLFPPLKSFWSQWTKLLSSALTGGPILLFLIYLAMQVFAGASAATGDEFSILNFVLAIILLIIALEKSGEFTEYMPGVAKSAVTYAAGIATGGLGGYVAGKNSAATTGQTAQFAENQAKRAGKWTDMGVGGVTNVLDKVPGTGVRNMNARYEKKKEQAKDQLDRTPFTEKGRQRGHDNKRYRYAEQRNTNGVADRKDMEVMARQEKKEFENLKEEGIDENVGELGRRIADENNSLAQRRAAMKAAAKLNDGEGLNEVLRGHYADRIEQFGNEIDALDNVIMTELENNRNHGQKTRMDIDTRNSIYSTAASKGNKSLSGITDQAKRRANQAAGRTPDATTVSAREASLNQMGRMPNSQAVKSARADHFFADPVDDGSGNLTPQFQQADFDNFLGRFSDSQIVDPKTWNDLDNNTRDQLANNINSTSSAQAAYFMRAVRPNQSLPNGALRHITDEKMLDKVMNDSDVYPIEHLHNVSENAQGKYLRAQQISDNSTAFQLLISNNSLPGSTLANQVPANERQAIKTEIASRWSDTPHRRAAGLEDFYNAL